MDALEHFRRNMVDRTMTHVWRGHGSAIFLELGELTPCRRRDGSLGHPNGQVSVMIEWSWRIERPRSILGGSWSSERKWQGMFRRLVGSKVTDVRLFGRLHELEVTLSNGMHVVSFMTADGQPQWAIIDRMLEQSVHVERGRLFVQSERP